MAKWHRLDDLPNYEPPPPPPRPGSFYALVKKLFQFAMDSQDDPEMEIGQLQIIKSKIDKRISSIQSKQKS